MFSNQLPFGLYSCGLSMSSGLTHWSNYSAVRNPSSRADSLREILLWWAFFAILAVLSYPMWGFKAVQSINELFNRWLIRNKSGLIPFKHLLTNDLDASLSILIECKTFLIINGLKTFSSKCPLIPPTVTAVWLPITCAQTMVKASHWVGLTFPGIMLEPGSFSGSKSYPRPDLGPLPKNLISLAILNKLTATAFKVPWNSTNASFVAMDSNLF